MGRGLALSLSLHFLIFSCFCSAVLCTLWALSHSVLHRSLSSLSSDGFQEVSGSINVYNVQWNNSKLNWAKVSRCRIRHVLLDHAHFVHMWRCNCIWYKMFHPWHWGQWQWAQSGTVPVGWGRCGACSGLCKPLTITKAERCYCVTRRELLAVVTFTKHFWPYLLGHKLRTDHGSLTWLC